MELLLISKDKIKISLTPKDLAEYKITCDDIDYDNTETRRVFWSILDEAKKRTGFDAAKSRIFIQIYPDKSGGCELYVSKIVETYGQAKRHGIEDERRDGKFDENGELLSEEIRPENASEYLEEDTGYVDEQIYCFEDAQALISACKRLKHLGFKEASSTYVNENGVFYLSLNMQDEGLSFLSEYAARCDTDSISLYIAEHCKEVCKENAVEVLGEL